MATKKTTEVSVNPQEQNAALIVNNAFIDGLSAQLQKKMEYGLTFPADYNPTNELMGAYLTLLETKDKDGNCVLNSCSQVSVANALMDMVSNGVSMSKKQCYPVAYKGNLQCQMSVYGNTCIARRYGLSKISAMVIYEGDDFDYGIEDGEIIIYKHKQDFKSIDNDKIVGAYAVAVMNDSSKHIEIMSMAQIKKAWSQGYGYRENGNGTHQKFPDQMAMKTVKNRCLKFIIRTFGEPTVTEYIEKSDEIENADTIQENVAYEVEQNANTVEFVESEIVEDVEVIPAFMEE